YLPSLKDISAAAAAVRMIPSDVEMLRLHYALTVREWLRRFTAARPRMFKLYDERFCRMWEFYLSGAIAFFEGGAGCNFQVQFIRDRRAVPITRDYMVEAEHRYRALEKVPAPPRTPRKRT
ncbi:MAG: class I SAM-dependent methyltransferase, partial [Sphingomicrobium sp.]